YARAEPIYLKTLDIRKQVLGENHPDCTYSLNNLAALYVSQGDYARAEPLLQKALDVQKQSLGEKHPTYAGRLNNLAALYEAQGDYTRAEPLYQKALDITLSLLELSTAVQSERQQLRM